MNLLMFWDAGISLPITAIVCALTVTCILLYKRIKPELRGLIRTIPILATFLAVVVALDEAGHKIDNEKFIFNLFYVERVGVTSLLPLYSNVQASVPFIWGLIVYVFGFTGLSGLILVIPKLFKKMENAICKKTA